MRAPATVAKLVVETRMRRAQSTVEYMLILAVMSVALVAAAYAMIPDFRAGIGELGDYVENLFAEGEKDGSADRR